MILPLLAVVLTAGLMSSCKGEPGRDGRDGRDGLVNYKVVDLQVNQNEWAYSNTDNNNYFYATFSVPELTWDIYNNGLVKVYREWDTNTESAVQMELPYIRMHEYLADEATSTWGFYQEAVDYEFTQGKVNIFYTASDFDYEIDGTFIPETMHFRLIMMW